MTGGWVPACRSEMGKFQMPRACGAAHSPQGGRPVLAKTIVNMTM